MAGSGPHQTSLHQAESVNLHQQDDFLNLECERNRENYQEGSVHTTYTSGSRFQRKSHISHARDDNKVMQREIDDLKKQLHRAQQSSPLPAPMSLPMMKRTLFTDRGQELHQVNPSPTMKSALTEENAEVLLAKEWELTL